MVPGNQTPWMLNTEDAEEMKHDDDDDDDLQVLQENIHRTPLHYIAVIKCTVQEDSFVDSSRVPGLKYLARGSIENGGLEYHPISVQVNNFL